MVYMGEVFEPLLIGRVHWTMFLGGMVFFSTDMAEKGALLKDIYIYICQYHFINMIFTKKIVT
jgi:hypothetical protein